MSKNWMEVVRANRSIANIPLFRINILLFNESVKLGSKLIRVEGNNKIELEQVFGLSCLSVGKNLSSQKIFKILVIYDNIDEKSRTF